MFSLFFEMLCAQYVAAVHHFYLLQALCDLPSLMLAQDICAEPWSLHPACSLLPQ